MIYLKGSSGSLYFESGSEERKQKHVDAILMVVFEEA